MSLAMAVREEVDPQAPQREAALFYGLFLRGHSAETLRRDIDVPKKSFSISSCAAIATNWRCGENLRRVFHYRKTSARGF